MSGLFGSRRKAPYVYRMEAVGGESLADSFDSQGRHEPLVTSIPRVEESERTVDGTPSLIELKQSVDCSPQSSLLISHQAQHKTCGEQPAPKSVSIFRCQVHGRLGYAGDRTFRTNVSRKKRLTQTPCELLSHQACYSQDSHTRVRDGMGLSPGWSGQAQRPSAKQGCHGKATCLSPGPLLL